MGSFGWQELLIIFVILLLLFGATRLPALSKSLGQSIRGFKKGLNEDDESVTKTADHRESEKDSTQSRD